MPRLRNVSRWFIERERGNRAVRRLLMLGTPNGGSPWPNVVDWATTAMAVGLNELSKVAWPAAVLVGLTQSAGLAQLTLDPAPEIGLGVTAAR